MIATEQTAGQGSCAPTGRTFALAFGPAGAGRARIGSGCNASPRLKPGDFWLGPQTARDLEGGEGMSYVVSTSMAAFCHGEDHPRGVPVAVCDASAGRAREGSFGQPEAFLGSRTALRAGHSRVGGRNQHLVKQIKGRSSRLLRQEFPSLRRRLPTLWTNSYFVATVGGAALEVVKRYVDNQRNA